MRNLTAKKERWSGPEDCQLHIDQKLTLIPFMLTLFPAEGYTMVKASGKRDSDLSTSTLDYQSLASLVAMFNFRTASR